MKLKLNKPIVFFDLETTGTNIATDRIVEISAIKLYPDGSQEILTKRINPGMPIPAEATAIHGISDDDVKDCLAFKNLAVQFKAFMAGCDLAGYNILRFDLPLLVEEMLRAGVDNFPEPGTRFIDAMAIFHHFEKRDLTAAVKFYCGKDHIEAHSAESDAKATMEVLQSQVEKYELGPDTAMLHDLCSNGQEIIDFAGKFIRNEKGEIVYAFGPHKGVKVIDETGFALWMLSKDFTFDTKEKAKKILNGVLK
jgi:DNA polymerase III subunit epsilon